jgi:hypothetical protein
VVGERDDDIDVEVVESHLASQLAFCGPSATPARYSSTIARAVARS